VRGLAWTLPGDIGIGSAFERGTNVDPLNLKAYERHFDDS
jgi:hypothetical protein